MNLVQQANFLEDVPKDQLVSMSQDPNAQFPAFLVLSEIQRRTTNEKNYQAMVNQPTTTVAEEVVSDFAQPTGLQGGAPQATPLPTNISAGLSGAPTAPMQMAASGGVTGYATGDMTALPAGSEPQSRFGSMMDSVVGILDAQDKRGLVGLQGKLTEAQISKIEADIAAMPVKEIQSELSIYSKLLDQIKENSTGTEAEIKQIQSITDYISALGQELMTARGINFAALDNKTKLLEASGIGKV